MLATGCSGAHTPAALPGDAGSQGAHRHARTLPKYVVVLVHENRTVDNLFQTQPGVNTRSFGFDSKHHSVALTPESLGAPWDCNHSHGSFVKVVTKGFDLETCGPNAPVNAAFSYVDPSEITPYTAHASQYAIADNVLQSNEDPSFPAHIYLIAATTGTPGSHLWIGIARPARFPDRQPFWAFQFSRTAEKVQSYSHRQRDDQRAHQPSSRFNAGRRRRTIVSSSGPHRILISNKECAPC